jgi:hypothetical protein
MLFARKGDVYGTEKVGVTCKWASRGDLRYVSITCFRVHDAITEYTESGCNLDGPCNNIALNQS